MSMKNQKTKSQPFVALLPLKQSGLSAVKYVLRRAMPGRARLANKEHLSLPPDIWYLIAHDYLVDFPATVAALSSTSRRFHTLLRFLKFRSVSIRFNTNSAAIEDKSSARRFAERILGDRQIINYIETMEIGYNYRRKRFTSVLAVDDAVPQDIHERTAFCSILSQPYPILQRLALLVFKDISIFQFPPNVFEALLSAFSLQSLREVSIVTTAIPSGLLHTLQQIDTLNLCILYIRDLEKPSIVVTKKCTPQTLKIVDVNTIRELFPHGRSSTISLDRLTALDIKINPRFVGNYVPWSFSSCYSTLINLKIFFDPWNRSAQVYDNIDLGKFIALKTLTLGFNLSRRSPRLESNSQQLQWVIDALLTLVEAAEPPSIEIVNLLIGDIKPAAGWIERLDGLPWGHLQRLFSSKDIPFRWPQLQEVNISLGAKKKNALSSSDRALLERVLALRVTNGSNNVFFRVLVLGRDDPHEFDDFWPIGPHSVK